MIVARGVSTWWTEADSAELDGLVAELVRSAFEHRDYCERCDSTPCPDLTEWREHLEVCKACRGDAPLSHGLPCDRYHAFVAHGNSCRRCNSCPSLRTAIEVVGEWREMRGLLSRAEYLRAERDRIEGRAA